MGTALATYDYPGEPDMAPAENSDLGIQVAELRSDVRHVQSDVRDIKLDIHEIKKDLKAQDLRLSGEIKALDQRMTGEIRALDQRMTAGFEKLSDSLSSAKIWALGMYMTLAGSMLYMIAKGAKWF